MNWQMKPTFSKPELPAIGIVADMNDEDRALLGNYGEFLPVHSRQCLIEEGAPQDCLFFVISGLLHVHMRVDGRDQLLARIEPGETLGEVNLFDPAEASASVTAQEFSQIWRANRDDIEAFVAMYPTGGADLLGGIVKCMSRRIRQINNKLSDQQMLGDFDRLWR